MARPPAPHCFMPSITCTASAALLRWQIATDQPCLARSRATALPMPRAPPVIRATFSAIPRLSYELSSAPLRLKVEDGGSRIEDRDTQSSILDPRPSDYPRPSTLSSPS